MSLNLIAIKNQLLKEKCTEHHQCPTVEIANSSINPHIKITACCDSFHQKLEDLIENLVAEQIADSVDNIFSKL